MINVPIFELMKLWGELVECYHGVNGYGGDTAEIYAYRLMAYSPLAHTEALTELGRNRKNEIEVQAANDLYELVRLFWVEFGGIDNCEITIDGERPYDWLIGRRFDHRAHVRVITAAEIR